MNPLVWMKSPAGLAQTSFLEVCELLSVDNSRNRRHHIEAVKKCAATVILSAAKDLQLFVCKELLQMLRCAQHDSFDFFTPSF